VSSAALRRTNGALRGLSTFGVEIAAIDYIVNNNDRGIVALFTG
jgi:hypothetical protein